MFRPADDGGIAFVEAPCGDVGDDLSDGLDGVGGYDGYHQQSVHDENNFGEDDSAGHLCFCLAHEPTHLSLRE